MTTEDYVAMFAGLFIGQLPTLVISSLGLWFAISRKRLPARVATWAIWGFALLIAHTFIAVTLRVILLGIRMNESMQGSQDLGMSIASVNLWAMAAYPLFVAGLAILARAIFLDRDGKRVGSRREHAVAGAS